ncbi:MAG: hypothetical protein RL654_2729 [Pseudomonadota bacterium]|jgi:hypothetical protein
MSSPSIFQLRVLMPSLLLSLLGATLSAPATAQWKWRDAQGRVQYSDRPPPTAVPERDILTRPAAPRNAGSTDTAARAQAAGASAATPGLSAAPPASAAAASTPAAGETRRRADEDRQARQRAENCARARDYARTVESGQRVVRTNERGEREFLDDGQRTAELRRAREVIASDCR